MMNAICCRAYRAVRPGWSGSVLLAAFDGDVLGCRSGTGCGSGCAASPSLHGTATRSRRG
jgi:hypothetical protein